MRMVYHLWRESGAGGGPLAWWSSIGGDEQVMLLAEARVRDREIRRANAERGRGGRR